MLDAPRESRDGILDRCGEGVLGSEPVVDREHLHVGVPGEQAARLVVRIEVADDPATAVEEDHEGSSGTAVGR